MGGRGGAGTRATKGASATGHKETYTGHDKLTPKQLEAVKHYQEEGGHTGINEFYRKLRTEIPYYSKDHIPHLDAALKRSTINNETTLYRGMTLHDVPAGKLDPAHLVGRTLRDPGYLSTSMSRKAAERFVGSTGEPVLIKIRVKAGTHALNVHETKTGSRYGAAGTHAPQQEHEVLFGRGTGVKITGARRRKDGTIVATAEIQ